MATYLFDENLPPQVARGLRLIGFEVCSIGNDPAPARGSTDAENVAWCRERGAVLLTTDRGRKDKEILLLLRRYTDTHVVFLPEGMPGPEISANFHKRTAQIEEVLDRGKRVRLKITRAGGLKKID